MCAKINIIVLFRSKNHKLDLGLLNIAQIIRDPKSGKENWKALELRILLNMINTKVLLKQ